MVSDRTRLLLRRNNGRLALQTVLGWIARDLGRDISPEDVGTIEEADALRRALAKQLHTVRAQGWPASSAWPRAARSAIEAALPTLGAALGCVDSRFLPPHGNVGPVRATPSEWLPAALRFTESSEEFILSSPDATAGLFLLFHRSDWEHGEAYPYEFYFWGPWLPLAKSTLPFERSHAV